jgi:MSHA biogenesis protein MshG
MSYRFKYKAVAQDGKPLTGIIEAENDSLAKKNLDRRGLIPINIRLLSERRNLVRKLFRPAVNLELLISFTTKLNTLIKAGIPIIRALSIIESEQENPEFGEVLLKIRQHIENGMTLSQAMEQFPNHFYSLFVSTVKAGETSGQMESILDRLNEIIEREIKTREMIKTAVRYPSYVLLTIIGAIAVVVTVVIPKFADFYKSNKAELPLPTKLVLDLSNFVTSYWYIVVFFAGIAIFAFFKFKASRIGVRFLDKIKLEMPIIGDIFLKMVISRFCYLLGTLLKSGLPLVEALRLVGSAVGNFFISLVINRMSDNVVGGGDLVSPMRESKYFSPMVIQMFTIGMESGRLDDLLFDAARYYDSVVEYQSKKLTSRIEPILTFFIGGMVLLLALAIFLPMWNLMQVLKK